jgi:hypothetical protein
MSEKIDWLKKNHTELNRQAAHTLAFITIPANQERLGFEGANLRFLQNEFIPKYLEYHASYSIWENPADRTPRIIADFLEKEDVFKEIYRKLYMGYLKNNPNVTDSDLEEMSLPKHSSSERHPVPIPTEIPDVTTDTSTIRRIGIHFPSKPKGVHGIEIKSIISDVPITEIKSLVHSTFDTRSPYIFEFEDSNRGKHFYFAVRWENNRGEKGPWSEISSSIIP